MSDLTTTHTGELAGGADSARRLVSTGSTDDGPPDAGSTAPDERGTTTIAPSAVEHITEAELGSVPGVFAVGTGLDKVVGRQYPKVSADVAGSRARLSVEVAVAWPYPLADVCANVRDTLIARLTELTGMRIDAIDVTAAKVVQPEAPARRRVQ